MNWTQQLPPPSNVWQYSDLAYTANVDADLQTSADQTYMLSLQAAAVEYAETALNTSLLTRTVTATFNHWGRNVFGSEYMYGRHELQLPRGPILSGITSVNDANGLIDPSKYRLEGEGCSDYLHMLVGWKAPLTVVYVAGYGSTASSVPADIAQAIRTHVATMYLYRESVADKALSVVPHSLAAFYAAKNRGVGVK